MTEEEKEAIEIVKEITYIRGIREDVEGKEEDHETLDIVLNLINKQQKEIEQQAKEIARQDRNIHKLNLDKIQQQKEIEELKENYNELFTKYEMKKLLFVRKDHYTNELLSELYIRKDKLNAEYISKDKIIKLKAKTEDKLHIVTPSCSNIEKINEFKNEGAVNILNKLLEE